MFNLSSLWLQSKDFHLSTSAPSFWLCHSEIPPTCLQRLERWPTWWTPPSSPPWPTCSPLTRWRPCRRWPGSSTQTGQSAFKLSSSAREDYFPLGTGKLVFVELVQGHVGVASTPTCHTKYQIRVTQTLWRYPQLRGDKNSTFGSILVYFIKVLLLRNVNDSLTKIHNYMIGLTIYSS